MASDDLAAFLRARWDAEEATARAAIEARNSVTQSAAEWSAGSDESGSGDYRQAVWAGDGAVMVCEMLDEYDEVTAAHIARHDPARVLADIAAKRRILDWFERQRAWAAENNLWAYDDAEPLKLLALPYADHHAYREERKP